MNPLPFAISGLRLPQEGQSLALMPSCLLLVGDDTHPATYLLRTGLRR